MKFFFLAVKRLILRKNILAIFRIIAILKKKKKKNYHFFGNITKYGCAKFHVKSIFLSGFTQGGVGGGGVIRQRYPGQIELKCQETSILFHSLKVVVTFALGARERTQWCALHTIFQFSAKILASIQASHFTR